MSATNSFDRESFWRALISRRKSLGLTVTETCEQAGVSPASFYQWQRKFREVEPRPRSEAATPALVPVKLVEDRRVELTLELPQGLRLRIPTGCDEAILRQVLRAAVSASQGPEPC
jgi:transposase-like protein